MSISIFVTKILVEMNKVSILICARGDHVSLSVSSLVHYLNLKTAQYFAFYNLSDKIRKYERYYRTITAVFSIGLAERYN